MNVNHTFLALLATATAVSVAGTASADDQVWFQGFESDINGFADGDSGWAGDITRVASGTNSVPSASDAWHAIVNAGANETNTGTTAPTGPFSAFDGYRDTWSGGLTASIDIYLSTGWATSEGFDYSVAANGQDGAHLQDYVFQVTKDTSTGNLLVGTSTGSNWQSSQLNENLESDDHYTVATTGWYTFEHVFRDAGDGTLAVDMNVRDAGGTLVFSELHNYDENLLATVVGGNRYAWFTQIDVPGGVAIDNHSLSVVPEPASLALLGLGGGAMLLRRRR